VNADGHVLLDWAPSPGIKGKTGTYEPQTQIIICGAAERGRATGFKSCSGQNNRFTETTTKGITSVGIPGIPLNSGIRTRNSHTVVKKDDIHTPGHPEHTRVAFSVQMQQRN